MADDPNSFVLEHLRQIRAVLDGLREDMRDLKERMSGVEAGFGTLAVAIASQSARMDRIDARLDRLESHGTVL